MLELWEMSKPIKFDLARPKLEVLQKLQRIRIVSCWLWWPFEPKFSHVCYFMFMLARMKRLRGYYYLTITIIFKYALILQSDSQNGVVIKTFIFKYALILQSDSQNGVVIKTYIARLISLPASCVFYVTRQVCLKINTLSHARSWKYV